MRVLLAQVPTPTTTTTTRRNNPRSAVAVRFSVLISMLLLMTKCVPSGRIYSSVVAFLLAGTDHLVSCHAMPCTGCTSPFFVDTSSLTSSIFPWFFGGRYHSVSLHRRLLSFLTSIVQDLRYPSLVDGVVLPRRVHHNPCKERGSPWFGQWHGLRKARRFGPNCFQGLYGDYELWVRTALACVHASGDDAEVPL